MAKDDSLYLAHMVEAAEKARRLLAGTPREQLAIVHLVQIIGEAARLVSAQGRANIPQLPWKSITGMRHRVVHDYLHVDLVGHCSTRSRVNDLPTEAHLPPHPPTT